MKVACLFCLMDPMGTGPYEPAPMETVSPLGYPLCPEHADGHGYKTLVEFSDLITSALTSSYADPDVACPVCGEVSEDDNKKTGPCSECEWQAPRPTAEWRLAWIASKRTDDARLR